MTHEYFGHKSGRNRQECKLVPTAHAAGHLCVVEFTDGTRLVVRRQQVRRKAEAHEGERDRKLVHPSSTEPAAETGLRVDQGEGEGTGALHQHTGDHGITGQDSGAAQAEGSSDDSQCSDSVLPSADTTQQ